MGSVSSEGLPESYQWFSDQIAGHHPSVIKNGKREIGLLKVPGSHEILKPKQDASRGEKEIHQCNKEVEIRDKDWGKSFDETNIQIGLSEYFSARHADLKMVLQEALDKLQPFKEFFESQESFKFFASSLLFVYEADKTLPINLRIVMIDFSHAFESNGQRDEGYLFGIKNLEKYLNSLISET